MPKFWSQIFGGVLTLYGIAGFFLSSSELFQLNPTHNIVHLVSGLLFLGAGRKESWNQLAMKVLGIFYGLLAIMGLFSDQLFSLLDITLITEIVYFLIALGALYIGFAYEHTTKDEEKTEQSNV
ncbi:DUF4383 domain-containing protein [Thermoactinomyces mirandus]|uniref:DUF4383 domain-containing protein n=1 Tax=Thermoactinomyces mirandus TaxID=2756294 RepID=A0A7W2AR25_9BACL|nr:DUF4383 domain-containing protein [Thermoactinomyces mirandus]MBA4601116.1 DUF4383 domain-containing protein [Thermoactinomyces mirandus]